MAGLGFGRELAFRKPTTRRIDQRIQKIARMRNRIDTALLSEMEFQVRKLPKLEKVWVLSGLLVLESPGVRMRNIHRVHARSQRGIDVGSRAVPDHPGVRSHPPVSAEELRIGLGVLFRQDLNPAKEDL